MNLKKFDLLLMACLVVLKTHGLPDNCDAVEAGFEFAGTPEQQQALRILHRALGEVLPPLPKDEVKQ